METQGSTGDLLIPNYYYYHLANASLSTLQMKYLKKVYVLLN